MSKLSYQSSIEMGSFTHSTILLEPYNSMIAGFQRPVDISVRNCLGEKGEKAM